MITSSVALVDTTETVNVSLASTNPSILISMSIHCSISKISADIGIVRICSVPMSSPITAESDIISHHFLYINHELPLTCCFIDYF